jgi:hypothetical protein
MKLCYLLQNDGSEAHHVKLDKSVPQRQVSYVFSHLWKLGKSKQNTKETKTTTTKSNQGYESQMGTTREVEGKGKVEGKS